MKEEMLIKRQQEIEKARVQNLEINMRDSGEFEEWKREQKEKEELERLEYMQRKKIEMELAREAAVRAQEDRYEENKQLVEEMKKESQQRMKERQELQQEQVEHKKKLIEQVVEAEKKVCLEKEKLIERNKKQADDAKQEMAKELERKKVEDEALEEKRKELIKQIRELEKQPRKRTKGYDPTETMGYGLLEEMSLAELRERVDQVRAAQKQEEDDRREKNFQKKDEYLSSLQKRVRDIQDYRKEASNQKQMEREAKKIKQEKETTLKNSIREQQLMEVQGKISKKKDFKQREEERIAAEVKETRLRQQYMNANKAMVEEKAWKSQQDGLEREIKERQNSKLINQEQVESVNMKERKILAASAKKLVSSKVEFNKEYDKSLLRSQKNNELLFEEEAQNKTKQYKEMKHWELEHTKNQIDRDQFRQKISDMSLQNSKKKKNVSTKKDAKNHSFHLPPSQYQQPA